MKSNNPTRKKSGLADATSLSGVYPKLWFRVAVLNRGAAAPMYAVRKLLGCSQFLD